ncbi:MAG: tellurite resistance TerB family protein [Pseudomonadota bacterium]
MPTMFDAKRLLDQFLGAPSQGNLPQVQGRGGFAAPQMPQGGLGGIAGGLGNVLGGNLGGIGGGAVAGGLAALLMGSKSGRKMAGTALQLGGMAVVGALAYKAYRDWQTGKTVTQSTVPVAGPSPLPAPPADTPFAPAQEAEQQSLGRHLLRAMIAAAKADGHIDAKEQAAIFAEMDKLPLDTDDKAFVMDELRKPLDVDAVAGAARCPEEAASIYTASLLAIDIDNPSERAYLGLLAARLNLDDALVKHLHATVEGATLPAKLPAA